MTDPMAAPLSLFQWGREDTTAKGTAVAATKRMVADSLSFEEAEVVVRPQIAKGLMIDNPGNELVVVRGTRWRASGPFAFDEFHRWLEMAIIECVTPTGSDPYTWTHTHNPAANAQIPTYTLQRRISDGTNHVDSRVPGAMLETLTVSGDANGIVRYEAGGFGRRVENSAITSVSHPTIEIPPYAASKVYLDPAWASLGSTQLTGPNGVLNWSFTIRSGAAMPQIAAARTDLDYVIPVRNGRSIGVDFRARVMIATDSGQMATERTAAEAQALRALQLQFDGTQSRAMTFKALLKHTRGSLYRVDESDGIGVFDLDLVTSTDATNAFGTVLVNKTNETP